jgi:hypothetical protein
MNLAGFEVFTTEYCVGLGHRILFHDTSILSTKARYMDRIVRKAIETDLHSNNMKRGTGFCLSKSWKPLISSPRNHRNMTPVRATRSTIGSTFREATMSALREQFF